MTERHEVTAFDWVPPFAAGLVRDLRVRWALEEAGLAYETRLLSAMTDRPRAYFEEQPFGQVPAYRDGEVAMFESGAIVLHIAERSETLMPRDPMGRARAISWVFAALNSVEPPIQELAKVDIFERGEDWAKLRRPGLIAEIGGRIDRVADWLGDREFLEDRFTAGDLVMTSVLRILRDTDLVAERPELAAYQARCEARPAFGRALAAQMGDFKKERPAAAV